MNKKIITEQRILKPALAFLTGIIIMAIPYAAMLFEGNTPNNELLTILPIQILAGAGVAYLFQKPNYIEITEKGVLYKNSPFRKKLSFLSKDEVAKWEISDYKFGMGFSGLGYRSSFRKKIFVQKFGKILKVKTKSGVTILFGINNAFKVKSLIAQEWDI